MLDATGINQYYGGSHILRDLSLQAPAGEITVVLGRNGVGKTTLLKCLMGVVPVKTGTVKLDGQDITHATPYQRVRAGIGYVPQGREIFGRLTVLENLQMGLASRSKASRIGDELFELFPVLKQMLRRRGGDLSGGQQQQLAIGRALAMGPKLLILDEPTEGIQPNIVREIGEVIKRLNREHGLTVLLVEQKLPFARQVASDFYLMDKGRLVAEGPIADLSEAIITEYLSV